MSTTIETTRRSWNLGRLVGPKPPFKPKHIRAIRTRLQHEGRIRGLALFNTAIDSKLRGCNLVHLRCDPPPLLIDEGAQLFRPRPSADRHVQAGRQRGGARQARDQGRPRRRPNAHGYDLPSRQPD
nr:hypothetical protein [Methylobacterium sp. GC_Met_2]